MCITSQLIIDWMAENNPNSSTKQKVTRSPTKYPLPLNHMRGEIDIQRNVCRVKTRDGSYGGYKKDILTENLSDRDNALLVCEICEGIMREACLSGSGKQFCSSCEVRDPNSPIKRTISFTKRNPPKQTPNVAVRRMVDSLKCSCPLIGRGCKWLGTLKDCEDHLDTCGYVHALCKLKCGIVLQRNELKLHEEKKCPFSITECEHCKGELKLGDMSTHLSVCPKMEVSCTMECGKIIYRKDIAQHLILECSLVEVKCLLGCEVKLTRSELKIHVSDNCAMRLIPCEHCGGCSVQVYVTCLRHVLQERD